MTTVDVDAGAETARAPAGWASRVFQGWWIVGGSMLLQALQGTLFFYGYSAFVPYWMAEFGWSRTTVSLAFSLHRTESALLGPVHGWLLHRFDPRGIVLSGVLALAAGFVALAFVTDFLQFMLVFLVMALGASFCGALSSMTVIVNWFDRRRATALSLMHLGFSVGGLAVPLLALALAGFGWRATAVLAGVIVAAVGIPVSRLMVREPEAMGLLPDNVSSEPPGVASQPGAVAAGALPVPEPTPTVASALISRPFWLMAIGQAAALAVGTASMVHLVVFANEQIGLPVTVAATLVAALTLATMVGQVVGGIAGDRLDRRVLAGVSLLGLAAAMWLMTIATGVAIAVAAVTVQGVLGGMRAPLMGALKADYFGRRNFASVSGYSSLITMIGAIGGPVLVGALADARGSYLAGFQVLALVATLGSLAFFALPRRRRRTST